MKTSYAQPKISSFFFCFRKTIFTLNSLNCKGFERGLARTHQKLNPPAILREAALPPLPLHRLLPVTSPSLSSAYKPPRPLRSHRVFLPIAAIFKTTPRVSSRIVPGIWIRLRCIWFGKMSAVNITNVTVLDNPAAFLNPFQFEISYECLIPLKDGKISLPAYC